MSRSIVLKVLTAGDGGVGKTTFLYRFKEGRFLEDTTMTLGVEFSVKTIKIDGITVNLQIWDFGGQEQFRFMLKNYVLGAHGAFLMFDLTRFMTLDHIEEWVSILRQHDLKLPILFMGTKLDLKHEIQIGDDMIKEYQEEFGLFDNLKISSKTGENIDEAFNILARELLKHSGYK